MAAVLEVRELMVFYENAVAANDISLHVAPGEIVAVFGSNGAGKTTLLNTIAGLTHHLRQREARRGGMRITVAGQIRLDGEDITHRSPEERVRRGVVLCRERHPLFRDCTVAENLSLGGYLLPARQVRQGMEFVLELFAPLRRLLRHKAGLLSGGEQEMVAIGMALVARPRFLLVDEPLLGLSPAMQRELVRGLSEIRRHGVAVLVAEQFARPLMPIIDRGYVIENGGLVTQGTREELTTNPEVRAAYLGAGEDVA